MREIEFRGKRVDNGEWIYGFYVNRCGLASIHKTFTFPNKSQSGQFFDVVPETVGQYIDITDKNDKKIFEGDIVRSIHNTIGKIIWFENGWSIEECDGGHRNINRVDEVIGNIYENLKLLESEE